MTNKTKEQAEQLRKLMRDILERDDALRKQYDIDKKFRFIRDRLDALSSKVEEQFEQLQEMEEKSQEKSLQEDEVYVYVYLYNAQGIVFRTWRNMLNPDVFYEYSINRPIYEKQSQIDAFINNKTNKAQHGYLTVVVKKDDILPEKKEMKDAAGHRLIKVREGALRIERLISFTHEKKHYVLNKEGELVKQAD